MKIQLIILVLLKSESACVIGLAQIFLQLRVGWEGKVFFGFMPKDVIINKRIAINFFNVFK